MDQMGKFRFTLLSLMVLVAFSAVGLAALVNASELWASATFTVTVSVLLVAILGIVLPRRESSRAFCAGLTVVGWGYMLIVFSPWFRPESNLGPAPLLTTKLLEYLYDKVTEAPAVAGASKQFPRGSMAARIRALQRGSALRGALSTSRKHFQQVGHSLLGLFFAFLGGLLARYLYTTQEAKPASPEPEEHDDSKAGDAP